MDQSVHRTEDARAVNDMVLMCKARYAAQGDFVS
jgi:hypothetical protein